MIPFTATGTFPLSHSLKAVVEIELAGRPPSSSKRAKPAAIELADGRVVGRELYADNGIAPD